MKKIGKGNWSKKKKKFYEKFFRCRKFKPSREKQSKNLNCKLHKFKQKNKKIKKEKSWKMQKEKKKKILKGKKKNKIEQKKNKRA